MLWECCLFMSIAGLDDLLTSAPGMSGGILFSRETKPESPGTVPTNVDLSEMLFGADTMIKWPDPVLNSQDIKVVHFSLSTCLCLYNDLFRQNQHCIK